MQEDFSEARPVTARALKVPLTADSVAPPRLVYGSLEIASASGRYEAYPAVYFEMTGGSLGRVTFEGLDAVKAARGELLPYDTGSSRMPGDWVFTVAESSWLAERHHYEMQLYSTPLLETYLHYLFQFHDEFVEAIAQGIWLDAADPARPFARPAQHPLASLPDSVPAQTHVSPSGIEWELRRSPRADSELANGSHLCSQRVWQFNMILDGRSREGASIWLRTRNGHTISRLTRPWPAGELGSREGLAQPHDFTEAWEECLAAIAERRRAMRR